MSMQLVTGRKPNETALTFFGPFTTKERAKEYADSLVSFGYVDVVFDIPLVVPNCTRVTIASRN